MIRFALNKTRSSERCLGHSEINKPELEAPPRSGGKVDHERYICQDRNHDLHAYGRMEELWTPSDLHPVDESDCAGDLYPGGLKPLSAVIPWQVELRSSNQEA